MIPTSWRRLASVMLLGLVVAGCHSLPPPSEFVSEYDFAVRGPISQEQVQTLDGILKKLNDPMLDSVRSISVVPDWRHFGEGYVAHCKANGDICFLPTYINDPTTVWHEVAHAHHFAWGCRDDDPDCKFGSLWREIAGNVYGKSGQKPRFYPSAGLLDDYSSTNYFEDVATFTADAYCYTTGRFSLLRQIKVSGEFHKDKRYIKKLRLLMEYKFITKAMFDEIVK